MTEITKDKGAKIRRVYEICLAGLTIEVGLLFIVQVWALFSIGEKAFSRASVAEHFKPIAPFVWLWLVAIVGAVVIWSVFPAPKETAGAALDPKYTLQKLRRRLPETTGDPVSESKKQTIKRTVVWCVCAAFCIACAIVAIVYLTGDITLKAQEGFFASHGEAERLLRATPWVLGGLCAVVAASYYDGHSANKEISLVKAEIVENAKKGVKIAKRADKETLFDKLCKKIPFLKSKWCMVALRAAIGVLAVVLIIIGIDNGGMADVLEKAINICTQCIGLG